ncbi:MAG: alpha/beta fold hydrolase [Acidobacteriota bacterium]
MTVVRPGSRRFGLAVGLCYALLLATSFIVRSYRRPAGHVGPLEHTAEVWAIDSGRLTSTRVRIAYREFGPDSGGDAETIVLLHGSPGRKEDFGQLAPVLARNARVVAPDLPGFGSSTRALPDYSFRAHGLYVRQLLDHLGVQRAHVLGYSMGGGVALSLADAAPTRVASLTMLSAIGVEEMELTGDYYVNHFVHGVQLGALWIAREGTPHMGLLDDAALDVPYARNFFDSDQRPLRAILQRVEVPTLIVHGLDDANVPIEAAREHHRLVPQSELLTLPGDHFLVSTKAADVGTAVSAFVRRASEGHAPMRAGADLERARLATLAFDSMALPRVRGIAAAVFGGLLTAAALVSENVTGAASGVLVARGRVSAPLAIAACVMGAFMANAWPYLRRRRIERRGFEEAPSHWLIAVSWLTSAVRTTLFLLTATAASWLLFRVTPLASWPPYPRAAIIVALVLGLLKIGRAAATEKGRRLLVSTWRRSTRWEFWPPWIFYPPVLAYIAYLMVKHRNATIFTAANPAILAGGVLGESKYDILQGLAGSSDHVARACLIDANLSAEAKTIAARRFMDAQCLTFPIVVKPNHGQRGSGVVIASSEDVLAQCLGQSAVDTIVQEYVGGAEFGVFYYRRPSESRGHIFSITEKRFPTVVGDGRRTLEELILQDERAVCAARLYCDRHRNRLSTVPTQGESITLAELGTHCRGALFLDGEWVRTPALGARFDTIAKGFDGFFFGRFDVRLESSADGAIGAFQTGHGFKILELNGVTSEATHIYHPGTPLTTAYRVLIRQWRIAFEIGAENRRRGAPQTSVRQLILLSREYLRTSHRHLPEYPPQSALGRPPGERATCSAARL